MDADALFEKGDFSGALVRYEQAAKEYEALNKSALLGNALYKMGACYNATAQYAQARQSLERAEKIHAAAGDSAAVGFDLIESARLETLLGKFKDSLRISQNALRIHEETNNKPGIAAALRLIALAYRILGEQNQAFEQANRSLAVSTEIGDKRGMAQSLNEISHLHLNQGNLQAGMEAAQKALAILAETADKRTEVQTLNLIGRIHGDLGEPARELEFDEKALHIAEEIHDLYGEGHILMNLGAVYYSAGHFAKANQCLQRSLSIAERIGNKQLMAYSLGNLGGIYFYTGNDDAAVDYIQKTIKLGEEMGDQELISTQIGNFGVYYFGKSNYKKALEYFRKSLRSQEESNDERGIVRSLNYIAEAQRKMGDYDLALETYQQALGKAESLTMKPFIGVSQAGIGEIYYGKKQMAEAETHTSKAIEISREGNDWEILWNALLAKGLILRDSGRPGEAIAFMKEAVGVIESVRAAMDQAEQKSGYFQTKRQAYEDLIQLLIQEQRTGEAFEYAQMSKARAFLDMLAEAEVSPEGNLSPQVRERKNHISKALMDIQNEIRLEAEKENIDRLKVGQLENQRTELERQYSNLLVEIREQNPAYASLQYPEPIQLPRAQGLLDDQTVLLEYFVGEDRSTLFAVTRSEFEEYALPGERILIDEIRKIRDVLQKPDGVWEASEQAHSNYLKLSALLYDQLVRPAQAALKQKQRIVIAPDGPLNYLPFESLISGAPAKTAPIDFSTLPYLSLDYEIHYVPSISVLAVRHERKPDQHQKELVVFANPSLPGAAQDPALVRDWAGVLGSLPYARAEAEGIAELYKSKEVSIYVGQDASEKNVKGSRLDQYRRIHFASHGLIDEKRPQFSALVLSPDSKEEEDGYLTMQEVFDLKLRADLVVLSACKTGLGQEIRGEGISGLSRAFLCAGAPSVLVSLWNVYDRSTADFMISFYRNMRQKNLGKARALRESRLEMIRSGKYSHPYYWSPFVLIGNQ